MTRPILLLIAALLRTGIGLAQTEENKNEGAKDFQITFITPLGTNGTAASKTVNRLSFNILAGVSKGTNGAELGGFVNTDLQDVRGLQIAGFANIVLRHVNGAQFSGFINYSGGNFDGTAFTGFCNVNLGNLKGGQFAGFYNTSKDSLNGAQFAGFCNTNFGTIRGAQISGFCNYNRKNAEGLQASGYINVTGGNHKGTQITGFGNVTHDTLEGIQIAGFFNYAKKVKGLQLGFINIADSVDGASIGLINIIKKGIHQVEASADEVFYTNLAFRTGTHKFYNIFSAGARPKAGNFLWNIGYGIGTSLLINDKLRSDVTLSYYHVSSGLFYHATSELYKLYIGLEYKIANKFYIAAGPTLNLYWADAMPPEYSAKYNHVAPYSAFNLTSSQNFNFKGWLGGKISIRFL